MGAQDPASAKYEGDPAAILESASHFSIFQDNLSEVGGYDDDDWVGEPPEGRYSRDRAKPEFWRNRWPLAGSGVLLVLLVVVLVIALLNR